MHLIYRRYGGIQRSSEAGSISTIESKTCSTKNTNRWC
jgi:hypothetical protein